MLSPDVMHVTLNSKIQLYGTRVEVKGIWITSPNDITVQCYSFYEIHPWKSAGGFMAYPVESLGREYVVVTYCKTDKCQFAIVATKNNTRVSIALRMDLINKVVFGTKTYRNGSLLQVTLKRYQTLQIRSKGDLTGTKIESSETIAVFAGAPFTSVHEDNSASVIYTRDHLVDQLPPVASWGSVYVISPFPNTMSEDYIRIVVYENTYVQVDGVLHNITIYDRYRQFVLPVGRHTIVTSDSPVLIAQLSQSTSDTTDYRDASVAIVVPVDSWRSEYVFSPLNFIDAFTYVSIVTTTSCISDVLLDGEPIASEWIEDVQYAHTSLDLNGTKHHLSVKKPSCTLSGTMFGTALIQAWSMPLGWYFEDSWVPESTSTILQESISPTIYDKMSSVNTPFTTQLSDDITPSVESPLISQLSDDIFSSTESSTTTQVSDDITTTVGSPFRTQLSDISTASLTKTQQHDISPTAVESSSHDILPTSVVTSEFSNVLSGLVSTMLTTKNYLPLDATASLHPSSNYLSNSHIFVNTDVHLQSIIAHMDSTTETGLTTVTETTDPFGTDAPNPTAVTTTSSPQTTANILVCNFCRCKNSTLQLDESLQILKEYLAVNKQALSATTRKYISIEDNRPSAIAVGFIGIVFLCLSGLLLSINDLIKLWLYWYSWCRKDD
ncbi:topoisomerase I damage affected protein 7-like [Gigantopelta aegis]|uniref:topoisomerase I damage affected protein 7-like n=1 Tax=Gigantopelta aegis TaxID=1735272 RepID=UPI001B88AF54|nr:topoisomerase I damage affected protein 7-like [Gigantopelta aegis]